MIASHSSSVGNGAGYSVEPHPSTMSSSSARNSSVLMSLSGSPSNSGDAVIGNSISFLHPVVGASDGRSRSAPVAAKVVARRGGATTRLRSSWRAMVRQLARLEDSAFGDALGVLFLFASLWGFLWLAPLLEELIN